MPRVEWIEIDGKKLLKIICPKTNEVRFLDEASFDIMVDMLGFEIEDVIAEVCGFGRRRSRVIEI
jgi:hypothetical protein